MCGAVAEAADIAVVAAAFADRSNNDKDNCAEATMTSANAMTSAAAAAAAQQYQHYCNNMVESQP